MEKVKTSASPREDRRGAVALVHVAIDDGHAAREPVALQHARGDGDVIEDAIALAAIGKGVVRAAGQVGGCSRRSIAAAAAAIVAPTERRARSTICGDHGKPMRRCASRDSVPRDRLRRIGACAPAAGRPSSPAGPRAGPRRVTMRFGEQPLAQARVLGHRETVALGQRQDEGVGVVATHARYCRCISAYAVQAG